LLIALLTDDAEHPLKTAVAEAKRFLRQDRYQRTLYLDSLSSDKLRLREFLNALGRVLAALHQVSIKSGSPAEQRRISKARRLINSASESLNQNASPRLVGLHLVLNLPL